MEPNSLKDRINKINQQIEDERIWLSSIQLKNIKAVDWFEDAFPDLEYEKITNIRNETAIDTILSKLQEINWLLSPDALNPDQLEKTINEYESATK